jgi:radical SAM protein with 4Fe4S-binding SPASM domain
MAKRKMGKFAYQRWLYGGLRAANRKYSARDDMAAQPFPRIVQLQTINACNAACAMCPYPLYKDVFPRGRMDDALFDKVAEEIATREEVRTFVPMLQNEPFLDKRLFDRIASFKQRSEGRVTVELVTNGAFLTDDNIARIRACGLDVLDISLDALSREVYDSIRVGLDYDVVLAGVERVIAADLPDTSILVRLVRLRDNDHEVRDFARHWRRRGVPVFIYTANNRAGALKEFDRTQRLAEDDFSPLYRLGRRAMRAYMGHCPVPFGTASVLHNGDVLLCTQDWARNEILGNLAKASIAEIWNGPRMREIRRLVSTRRYDEVPACRDCSLWKDGWV